MQRVRTQGSTVSTQEMLPNAHSSHLGDVSVPGVLTTIPFREQCRCRRFWFFHHDIRAFTTSWLPLPIFAFYRVLLFLYVLVWLILHIVFRADEFGPHWLIMITNLGYTLLLFSTGATAVLCVTYAITHCISESRVRMYIPKRDFPLARIYKQDNIPWFVKLVWWVYITAAANAFLVVIGYWGFIYTPCGDDDDMASQNRTGSGMENSVESGSGSNSSAACSDLDVHTIQVHGINLLIVLLDIFISRIPYQILHFFYPMSFSLPYTIFTIIYWGAGATNHLGEPYVYSSLDYGNTVLSWVYAIMIAAGPMVLYLVLFFVAWVRDLVYARIDCCFRDVRQLAYRDADNMEGGVENSNGITGDEMTKV